MYVTQLICNYLVIINLSIFTILEMLNSQVYHHYLHVTHYIKLSRLS
jgi:hypothetical protein